MTERTGRRREHRNEPQTSYDENRDITHGQIKAVDNEKTAIVVSIRQYDTGERKIAIDRSRRDAQRGGAWVWTKLGRMTYNEFAAVARAVKALRDKGAI